MQNEELGDSFWSRFLEQKVVVPGGVYDCVLWAGKYKTDGYGVFIHRGREYLAHRMTFRYHYRRCQPLRDKAIILHSCNNRACINPLHLSEGSARQNTLDAWVAGRHPGFKIGPGRRRQMMKLASVGHPVPLLCARFGVKRNYVADHKRLVRLGRRSPLINDVL